MTALAAAIRTAREKRDWTQSELAARLQVTQSTISFWETGAEVPSLENQVRLVELLPEILAALAEEELKLLDRIQALERRIFDGKCGCEGCNCTPNTPVTPLSQAIHERGQGGRQAGDDTRG